MRYLYVFMLGLLMSSCAPTGPSKPDTQKVEDNQYVIVKDKDLYGVFKLFEQDHSPERTKYQWSLFEEDFKSGYLKEIETGEGFAGHDPMGFFGFYNDRSIEFGPFKLRWSINTSGMGWVYFKTNYTSGLQSYCIPTYLDHHQIEGLITGCQFKVMPW